MHTKRWFGSIDVNGKIILTFFQEVVYENVIWVELIQDIVKWWLFRRQSWNLGPQMSGNLLSSWSTINCWIKTTVWNYEITINVITVLVLWIFYYNGEYIWDGIFIWKIWDFWPRYAYFTSVVVRTIRLHNSLETIHSILYIMRFL
jgi:hypothetical protein